MSTPTSTMTMAIRSDRVETLRKSVVAINRKAKRLGVAPYEVELGQSFAQPRRSSNGHEYHVEMQWVSIVGETIRLGGWRFVARVDFMLADDGNLVTIINKQPGEALEIGDTTDLRSRCDHCRTRRNRSSVFVVAHEDGRTCVVGSSCLADFTGHGNHPADLFGLVLEVSRISEFGDEGEGGEGGGGSRATLLVPFLAVVSAVIRAYGWMSRTEGRDRMIMPTADIAMAWLGGETGKRKYSAIEVTRSDRAFALLAARWASRLVPRNDYEHNVHAIGTLDYVVSRTTGVAASIASVYARHRQEQRARALVNKDAQIGEVGERVLFDAEVIGMRTVQTYYGPKDLVTLVELGTGATITWFTAGALPDGLEPGARLRLAAKVKQHETFRGVRQTVVTRLVKHVELQSPPPSNDDDGNRSVQENDPLAKTAKKTVKGKRKSRSRSKKESAA